MPSKPATRTTSKAKWRPKAGAPRVKKAARPLEERLKREFVSLTAQIDGGHFKNAIKSCNRILVLTPEDADVLQTKLFLLLQTEQYAGALDLSTGGREYERAYALYRLNRETEAREVISGLEKDTKLDDEAARGVDILAAQLEYRQGGYERAVQTFTVLLDTCAAQSDEHNDLLTNLAAAQSHKDFLTTGFQAAVAQLPANVLQSLETAPPPTHPATAAAAAALAAHPTSTPAPDRDTSATQGGPKPPRPSRVPKGVVPGVTPAPDPERWIKKSERTNLPVARHRKGKKVVGAAGTTQGSTSVPDSVHPAATTGASGGKKKRR
ncbi:hypothetical protein BKA62DRAFT_447926 [Auriculariales sp. MPI-PUGE-AT-0066]|nr:hypothetical protein BKA62DRAFT_447926 [Auriculariales sp. MPI-PUGE-AT-0066]